MIKFQEWSRIRGARQEKRATLPSRQVVLLVLSWWLNSPLSKTKKLPGKKLYLATNVDKRKQCHNAPTTKEQKGFGQSALRKFSRATINMPKIIWRVSPGDRNTEFGELLYTIGHCPRTLPLGQSNKTSPSSHRSRSVKQPPGQQAKKIPSRTKTPFVFPPPVL